MRKNLIIAGLLSSAAALCGCTPQPDAIIHWHKVGACNGGTNSNGIYSAGPNAAYVVYAIESVDNTQVNQSWTLTAINFHSGSANFDPNLMIYSNVLGPFALQTFPITANQSVGFSTNAYGALVVSTTAADGASEADTGNYPLLYTPVSGAPGVIMEQTGGNNTPYTPDCSSISLK